MRKDINNNQEEIKQEEVSAIETDNLTTENEKVGGILKEYAKNKAEKEARLNDVPKFFKKPQSLWLSVAIIWLGLLFFVSERWFYAFLGHYTFPFLPYLLVIVYTLMLGFSLVLLHKRVLNRLSYGVCIANCVLSCIAFGLFLGTINNIVFTGIEFLYGLLYTAPIMFLLFVVFEMPKNKMVRAIVVFPLLTAMIVGSFFYVTDIRVNGIKVDAVVYAVEDDYQIVWNTYSKGVSYVEIAGIRYYDDYAGYARSEDTVHKVTVKQSVLDTAKSYTVVTRAMLDREPYSALQGATVSSTHSFRPIDETDGIQYYAIADVHDYKTAAVKAASYFGDKLDFLIMDGDISSFIARERNAEFIDKVASDITKGERPVVFARGNHETKSVYGDQLYKYVGSVDENFYFTFRLGSVWGVVLDMGEDHDDEWWEFYGAADFETYRQAQVEFLDEIIANKSNEYDAEGVTERLVLSHQAISFTFGKNYFYDTYKQLNERLNQMNIDVMLSGHRHEIMYLQKGVAEGTKLYYSALYNGGSADEAVDATATGAQYPTILVGRRANSQLAKENKFGNAYTGTAFEFDGLNLTLRFTNTNREQIDLVSPWYETSFGKQIVL